MQGIQRSSGTRKHGQQQHYRQQSRGRGAPKALRQAYPNSRGLKHQVTQRNNTSRDIIREGTRQTQRHVSQQGEARTSLGSGTTNLRGQAVGEGEKGAVPKPAYSASWFAKNPIKSSFCEQRSLLGPGQAKEERWDANFRHQAGYRTSKAKAWIKSNELG